MDWFRQRLVWNDPAVVKDLVKNGLFYRIYTPQVGYHAHSYHPHAGDLPAPWSLCCSLRLTLPARHGAFSMMHAFTAEPRPSAIPPNTLGMPRADVQRCQAPPAPQIKHTSHTVSAPLTRLSLMQKCHVHMQVLIRGFISANERAAASAVGPDPGKQLADGRAAGSGGTVVGAALAQQVNCRASSPCVCLTAC